ncbi:MAG: hypothetical protein FIA91_02800 [Geobacter sp.]|nr:hypothetical protein [Geobacter sp.]
MKKLFLAALLSFAASTASAEYINGQWVDPSWVKLHEVKTMKIVSAVARQQTKAYHGNQRKDLAMQTTTMEKVPSIMTEETTEILFLDKPRKIKLAGDEEGRKGFKVDNFILVEIMEPNGKVTSSKIVGKVASGDSLLLGGKRVSQLQPNSMMFTPKQVDIGPLPVKKPFKLKITALDYGEFGEVNDVYMLVE